MNSLPWTHQRVIVILHNIHTTIVLVSTFVWLISIVACGVQCWPRQLLQGRVSSGTLSTVATRSLRLWIPENFPSTWFLLNPIMAPSVKYLFHCSPSLSLPQLGHLEPSCFHPPSPLCYFFLLRTYLFFFSLEMCQKFLSLQFYDVHFLIFVIVLGRGQTDWIMSCLDQLLALLLKNVRGWRGIAAQWLEQRLACSLWVQPHPPHPYTQEKKCGLDEVLFRLRLEN